MKNLEDFIIENVPATCYYIPDFITESEEKLLLHQINTNTPVKNKNMKI